MWKFTVRLDGMYHAFAMGKRWNIFYKKEKQKGFFFYSKKKWNSLFNWMFSLHFYTF